MTSKTDKVLVGILMGSDSDWPMMKLAADACAGAGGAGRNAGLLAVQMLATGNEKLRAKDVEFKARLAEESRGKNARLRG